MITAFYNHLAEALLGKATVDLGSQALTELRAAPAVVVIPTVGSIDRSQGGQGINPALGRVDDRLASREITVDVILLADDASQAETLIWDVLDALRLMSIDDIKERWEPDEYITETAQTVVLSIPLQGAIWRGTRVTRLNTINCAKCAAEATNG